ncbi:MAG TPA: hypothetical protein VLV88_08860 [Terriglobales bacterium]|nr:hypothetical protein [Terriglobales bacterium]HUL16092.1 hypothetical protein [Terriglobales bacterium]
MLSALIVGLSANPALCQNRGGILQGSTPAKGAKSEDPHAEVKLTLRVYNYAHVDRRSLAQSEEVATRIFLNIGIETEWLDCPVLKNYRVVSAGCDTDMGASDLVVRILPREMAQRLRMPGETLGLAQACPDHEPACELDVLYSRVDQLAAKGYRADRILAYAIAHEVAHVLIGPEHSKEGIMRGEWTPTDLQYMSWGIPLHFTREQSQHLYDAVLRRNSSGMQLAERSNSRHLGVE